MIDDFDPDRRPQPHAETLSAQIDDDLAAIRRAMRAPVNSEIARGELTAPQMSVMQTVVRQEGISLKTLSQSVSLAHSTVSGIVDRLERKGLLERRTDHTDGRATRIYPTDSVREFVRERLPKLTQAPLQRALARASQVERARIGAAVRRLRALMEETAPELLRSSQ